MSKHTKEPWMFKEGNREKAANSTVYKADDPDMIICHVICEHRNDLQRVEDIANARLIAASPELLASLQAIRRDCEEVLTGREPLTIDLIHAIANGKARAAIAKATGG